MLSGSAFVMPVRQVRDIKDMCSLSHGPGSVMLCMCLVHCIKCHGCVDSDRKRWLVTITALRAHLGLGARLLATMHTCLHSMLIDTAALAAITSVVAIAR